MKESIDASPPKAPFVVDFHLPHPARVASVSELDGTSRRLPNPALAGQPAHPAWPKFAPCGNKGRLILSFVHLISASKFSIIFGMFFFICFVMLAPPGDLCWHFPHHFGITFSSLDSALIVHAFWDRFDMNFVCIFDTFSVRALNLQNLQI